jgi:hypothetical protein
MDDQRHDVVDWTFSRMSRALTGTLRVRSRLKTQDPRAECVRVADSGVVDRSCRWLVCRCLTMYSLCVSWGFADQGWGCMERSRRLWLQLASPEAWAVLGSGEPAGG